MWSSGIAQVEGDDDVSGDSLRDVRITVIGIAFLAAVTKCPMKTVQGRKGLFGSQF